VLTIHDCSVSADHQAQVLEDAHAQMSEILSRLQDMQNETNALRVPQAHLSICAHLSRQIQSRKEQTQRVRAASAELRRVLKTCVDGSGGQAAGDEAPRCSIQDVCARLQDAVSSMQHSGSLGASAQAALTRDVPSSDTRQSACADALGNTQCSSELRSTLHGQIEALLQLPQSVLDKLPS
jgi:hypothetical protein